MAMQMLLGGVRGAVPLLSLQALPAALASTPSAVWEPMIAKVRHSLHVPHVQTPSSAWQPVESAWQSALQLGLSMLGSCMLQRYLAATYI